MENLRKICLVILNELKGERTYPRSIAMRYVSMERSKCRASSESSSIDVSLDYDLVGQKLGC